MKNAAPRVQIEEATALTEAISHKAHKEQSAMFCFSQTTGRQTALILVLVVASFALPRHSAAQGATQSAPVVRALADLLTALDGSYGDEGAEIARRIGDLSEAAADWDRAIRDSELKLRARIEGAGPDDAAFAHEALGSAYLERGRFADAVAEFEAGSRLAPQRMTLHLSRAVALDAMGSAGSAAAAFRRAWTLEPDNPVTAYLALARSAIDGADLTRARDTLLRSVQSVIRGARPRTALPFPHPGLFMNESGDTLLFPLARYADGFARAVRGQIDEAVASLREAAASDPLIVDPASRTDGLRQASDSLRRGSLRAALAALEKVVATWPGSSEAHRLLATGAGLAGDTRTSIEHFEAALRIRPDDERSWMALASTHAEAGSLVAAARTLEKAIAAIPGSGRLRWRLAGLLVRLEQVGDALAHYTQAERLTPMSGRAVVHQAVGTSASLQQDLIRAAAAGDQRVRANLDDAAAHRDLASLYLKQGRQDEAFAELAIAAWLDPDDPLTFVTLGHSLMADRRDQDAVAALERAVTLQPDLREARYALAQALTRASRRADAERHLLEFERQRAEAVARERRGLDLAAAKGEAATQSAAGQHRQAVENWQRVIALEPDVPQNYLELAEALVKAGRLAESLQYFVKTAEMDGVAEVHLRLADVLARLGRARESTLARETYESLRLADFRLRASR
jgi:tetratricopeptide (TPR) repeat protein